MTTAHDVSVVMSVYNGADTLPSTLQGILDQEGCNFEFIVVNDGSTDASGRILDEWAARDARLRVIHQANTGLTRALIHGCAEARGEFIARQDCGDVSLWGRLASQVEALHGAPDAVMVACGARFIGPAGERLYEVIRAGTGLHEGLSRLELNHISGPPHHGSTMFRRADYLAAGGYRAPFVVAQDIDLWLRLAERGRCIGQAEVGYLASMEPGSISGRRRTEQFRLAELAIACARQRRSGMSDQPLLDAFSLEPRTKRSKGPPTGRERARFLYFVGSCLRKQDPAGARKYFRLALKERPLFLKAMLRSVLG